SLGTYAAVGSLNITGGNGADTVTVNLNGNTFTGSLLAITGNGNDSVTVQGAGGILGNTTINTGAGNDTAGLNSVGRGAERFGTTVQLTDALGANTANVGNAGGATTVGRDLVITGYNTVDLGAGAADLIGGSVTINNGFVPLGNAIKVAD